VSKTKKNITYSRASARMADRIYRLANFKAVALSIE